jgi:predicted transcriptional regulator YdeE
MKTTMKKIDQKNNIQIVGLELRTANTEAMQTIPPFWQKFYQEGILQKIPNRVSDDVYAVYTNLENEGKNNEGVYSLIIGAEVRKIGTLPKNFVSTVIKPSKRAVFEVEKGHPEKVGEKWLEIWQTTDIKKTFLSDYELYHASGEIEIYLGIK